MRPSMPRWELPFSEEATEVLTRTLPSLLYTRRWFGSKARHVGTVRIVDSIPIPGSSPGTVLLILVEYDDGGTETYNVPVIVAVGEEAECIRRDAPQAILAPIMVRRDDHDHSGLLYDALWNRDFTVALLQVIGDGNQLTGCVGSLIGVPTQAFADLAPIGIPWEPAVMQAEQSNTSVAFNGRLILKLFRRLEQGMSPDFEIGRLLTERQFPYVPPLAGALEYQDNAGRSVTLGLLQKFVPNEGDAWRYSLKAVERFVDRVVREQETERPPGNTARLLDLARQEYSPLARRLIGDYLESAERLGLRTAELHSALGQVVDDVAFAPEPFTAEYRQDRYESIVRGMASALTLLEERMEQLSRPGQAHARLLVELRPSLERLFDAFRKIETPVPLIRCHGDYHLGQVLWTGCDFMIIDFEGEPARPLAERRMKHPVVMDLAGMIRSFHYAPFAFMKEKWIEHAGWASFWSEWTSAAFLKGYLGGATGATFWPQDSRAVRLLLDVYVVEKALYELQYELNNRPQWADIPLHGLVELVKARGTSGL